MYLARNRKAHFTAAVRIAPSLDAVETFVPRRTYFGICLLLYRDVLLFEKDHLCHMTGIYNWGQSDPESPFRFFLQTTFLAVPLEHFVRRMKLFHSLFRFYFS